MKAFGFSVHETPDNKWMVAKSQLGDAGNKIDNWEYDKYRDAVLQLIHLVRELENV